MTDQQQPCPECRASGQGSTERIGSRRFTCGTCNRFAANSARLAKAALAKRYPAEYQQARAEIETELYAGILAKATATK